MPKRLVFSTETVELTFYVVVASAYGSNSLGFVDFLTRAICFSILARVQCAPSRGVQC
jgi:hypothetical protein